MPQRPAPPHLKLLAALPPLSDLLRGSLLQRHTFHPSSVRCSPCSSGQGHLQWVLNVNYPARKNRQTVLHPSQLGQVRRQLANLDRVRKILERICQANLQQLRAQRDQLRSAPRD